MTNCPYCGYNDLVAISHPITSMSDDWDIEQLASCRKCQREFIFVYTELGTKSIEESTIFEESESPKQSNYKIKE